MLRTLGELRELIIENEGVLEIGVLKLTYTLESDVDISLGGQIVMWASRNRPDEAFLTDEIFSIANDINEAKEALKEKREGKREENNAKELLAKAEKKLLEAQNAIGKVEAYEKILIGRDLTIGK